MKSLTLFNNLLLVNAMILLTCSFFLVPQTYDIRVIYTYYVIGLQKLYWCLSILVLALHLFYRYRPLPIPSVLLGKIHILLTAVFSLWIVAFHIFNGQNLMVNRTLNRYDVQEFRSNNLFLTILLFLLLFVQIFLVVNVAKGQVVRWKTKHQSTPKTNRH